MSALKMAVREQGQAMSEFAIVTPILILLIMGMVLSGMYAFRTAAVDWGVFITGVGAGTFNTPADGLARKDVLWSDIRGRILTGSQAPRHVQSVIAIDDQRAWIYGLNLVDAQRASTNFRLWRFYPGPPPAGVTE